MSDQIKVSNICSICKKSGTKQEIPYKVIRDTDGTSVKFLGAVCNECYEKIMPKKETKND